MPDAGCQSLRFLASGIWLLASLRYRTTRPHMLKRYRRMKKMKISEGMTSAKPPANLYGSCELLSEASTCAGNVRFFTVRIVAAKTSFQEATKVKIAVA